MTEQLSEHSDMRQDSGENIRGKNKRNSATPGKLSLASATLAATMAVLGCGPGSEKSDAKEHVGEVSSALSNWEAETTPNLGLTGYTLLGDVVRSESNTTLFVVNSGINASKEGNIYKVGTNDGTNWNSPPPTLVEGANSTKEEYDFKICGQDAFIVSARGGNYISKLYKGSWDGAKVVTPLTEIPNITNVQSIACDNSTNKLYAASYMGGIRTKVYSAKIGEWNWTLLDSCSIGDHDTLSMSIYASNFYVATKYKDSFNDSNLSVFKFDGNVCFGGAQNLNDVPKPGSDTVNNAGQQGTIVIDSKGDRWNSDTGPQDGDAQIKWAKAKITPDGGAGGSGSGTTTNTISTSSLNTLSQSGSGGGTGSSTNTIPQGGSGSTGSTDTGSGLGGGTASSTSTAVEGGGGTGGNGGAAGSGGQPEGGGGAAGSVPDSTTTTKSNSESTGSKSDAEVLKDCLEKLATITENPENVQIKSCDDNQYIVHVTGPSAIKDETFDGIRNWKFMPDTDQDGNVKEPYFFPTGDFMFTRPGKTDSSELNVIIHEEGLKNKLIETQHGEWFGHEGTGTNKKCFQRNTDNKCEIAAFGTTEGKQRQYAKMPDPTNPNKQIKCEPVDNSLSNCTPRQFTFDKSASKESLGLITAGHWTYKELITGEVATTPTGFQTYSPVKAPEAKGCGCETPGQGIDKTRDNLAVFAAAVGLGLVLTRRKGFIGLESNGRNS